MVSEWENRKDLVQELGQSAAEHVGRIAGIVTSAVRDVTKEIGDWFTDVFEMREAVARSNADREHR